MNLLDYVLDRCKNRYFEQNHCPCVSCTYEGTCPGSCDLCLEKIHYPARNNGQPARKYDCPNMADYYACKYSCRYASEIVHALRCTRDVQTKRHLKVLSFGCGPCSDLMALDYLRSNGEYSYESMDYRGVEYSAQTWNNIYSDIRDIYGDNFRVYNQDACIFIDQLSRDAWVPDITIFQYVFSDMQKNSTPEDIDYFITTFSRYAQRFSDTGYIILNDINLGNGYGGGRDHFDMLKNKLNWGQSYHWYFRNDNPGRGSGYPYGNLRTDNANIFDSRPYDSFSPYKSCSSAQMIIKKGEAE